MSVTRPAPAEAERRIWEELEVIPDPEIPAIGLVDLGVIGSVVVTPDGSARIELLPTFVGCPAIGVMQTEIERRVGDLGVADAVEVTLSFDPPWTSNRITEHGRERLRLSGFAPPAPLPPADAGAGLAELDVLAVLPVAECPYCGSSNTTLDNPFGPTLCRAIYHCDDCRQPFEQFKRV